jgi:hypothetical protein
MQYIVIAIQVALVLWIIFNVYQFGVAYRIWRNDPNLDSTFLAFLLERLGALGNTFVQTFVYTTLAIGAGYLIYEFIAMLME